MFWPGRLILLHAALYRDIYCVFKNKTTYNLYKLQNTNINYYYIMRTQEDCCVMYA